MAHDVRIVPLDGRPHLPENLKLWHGDSRGHWDGDTLVVRTKNFSPKSNFRRANADLEIEERLRRNSEDQLEYTLQIKDDSTWVSDWTVSYPMIRSDGPIYEFACHEGNHAMAGILAGARRQEMEYREKNGL